MAQEKSVSVVLADSDLDLLNTLTARERCTASEVLRRALRVYGNTDVPGRLPEAAAGTAA